MQREAPPSDSFKVTTSPCSGKADDRLAQRRDDVGTRRQRIEIAVNGSPGGKLGMAMLRAARSDQLGAAIKKFDVLLFGAVPKR